MSFQPITLCTPVAAGTTLSKLLWPGSYTVTLPGQGQVADITSTGSVVGGVFRPDPSWGAVKLDFAGVGSADVTVVFEIGQVFKTGTLTKVLGSVSLKSITTSGTTTADINPFTGDATASTTWRLFDLATLTSRSNIGSLLVDQGGTEDNTPARLVLDVSEALYYYVLLTTLSTLTKTLVVITPEE